MKNQAKTVCTVVVSKEIDNKWIWCFNKPLQEDPKEFMLENVQSYINGLFQLGKSNVDSMIVKISEVMIKDYPKLIYGYNNIGTILSVREEYEQALKYFHTANEIDPTDILVLSNMAEIYTRMDKKELAIERLKRIIEYGNNDDRNWAEKRIKQLK